MSLVLSRFATRVVDITPIVIFFYFSANPSSCSAVCFQIVGYVMFTTTESCGS
jgi:ABC-type transport system involved in Fe-S cluster assembly fused permease/ATPase subunit